MKLKVVSTGSIGNCYILENETEALIIECGVPVQKIKEALDFNFSKVVGALVTHEHGDHNKGMVDVMKQGVDVYASAGTHKASMTIGNHRAKICKSKEQFSVGNFRVIPFDVKHDVLEPVGFLINHTETGNVLFLTDSIYSPYTFKNLNNIIIEANYSKEIIDRKYGAESGKEFLRNRVLRSHFSLENCKDMLAANDLKMVNNIVLIHLSDSNSNEVQFQSEVYNQTGKTVTVASNGMIIPFKKTPF